MREEQRNAILNIYVSHMTKSKKTNDFTIKKKKKKKREKKKSHTKTKIFRLNTTKRKHDN